jgi:inorganic phosphate transporter, PiT family
MLTLLIVILVMALIFDLVNGFHDAANSIATVVSTKVLTPLQAVIWAAFFNVAAYWVFDMSVGNTVAKTVNSSGIDLWVILAGLIAATFWNLFTWWLGLPSSSSHTLIGGFAGAAVAHAGFDVLNMKEILPVIAFIFLAPFIGGIIAFIIALITISRNIWWKTFMSALMFVGVWYLMDYLIDYKDVKPVMKYIVLTMLGITGLTYVGYHLFYGKRQTAVRESNMYKKLQLLSSAAFSLGHGGADSQKVMGIMCAACIVFANADRKGEVEGGVPEYLKVSEELRIVYKNEEGKLKKFKPKVGTIDSIAFYKDGDDIIDSKTQEVIFAEEKANPKYSNASILKDYSKVDDALEKFTIYSNGDSTFDENSHELVFLKTKIDGKKKQILNASYSQAGAFKNYTKSDGSLLETPTMTETKLETKVNSETMPSWIAFSCYLAIGLGTLMGGSKIIKTMGTKITKVTPLEGVCAETAGALTLFTVSNLGIPVSTTHTITGSIIGVGATKRLSAVRWGVTISLLWAWILTIPVSAAIAALVYWGIKLIR